MDAAQSTLPDFGIDPADNIALLQKFMIAARDQIDLAFGGPDSGVSKANLEIWMQVVAMMHQDYVEAVRIKQRTAEIRP